MDFKRRYFFRVFTGIVIFSALLFSGFVSWAGEKNELLWQKLRSGQHFAMIRHAIAPGVGDPATFTIQRCETQRNLSEQGRNQARHIGALFRENGIGAAQVYSSQWCRCLDTAELLDMGRVRELPILNSFFQNFDNKEPQTEALARWLDQQDLAETVILVTHQVNITAFTGIYPRSGEIVIVQKQEKGKYIPVGTIKTD